MRSGDGTRASTGKRGGLCGCGNIGPASIGELFAVCREFFQIESRTIPHLDYSLEEPLAASGRENTELWFAITHFSHEETCDQRPRAPG